MLSYHSPEVHLKCCDLKRCDLKHREIKHRDPAPDPGNPLMQWSPSQPAAPGLEPRNTLPLCCWLPLCGWLLLSCSLWFSPQPLAAELPLSASAAGVQGADTAAELLRVEIPSGQPGGLLRAVLRAEPKTFNPVISADGPSLAIAGLTMANLIRIDRHSLHTVPALAHRCTPSEDGRRLRLDLRRGLRFSDGHPFDADDVVFSFAVYTDAQVSSPSRDLLKVAGRPITAHRLGPYAVEIELAAPYAVGERLFDGIAILPRHKLERAYRKGRLRQAWSLGTPAEEIVGMGPFRLRRHVAGQYLELERNPHYWKVDSAGQRLPYLERLIFAFVPDQSAEAIRLQSGEADLVERLAADNFERLRQAQSKGDFRVQDLGAGLQIEFLFFNLNPLSASASAARRHRQRWFRSAAFRRAISAAIDRQAIIRLVWRDRAQPLRSPVSPGNRAWYDSRLPPKARSLARARSELLSAGFHWNDRGDLLDSQQHLVELSLITSASNSQRRGAATLIQEDLRQLGIRLRVTSLEFRALVDRVTASFDYDTCLLGLGGTDTDPNPMIALLHSQGATHFWQLGGGGIEPWQKMIDQLLEDQLINLDPLARKRQFDQVQQLVVEHQPFVPLLSPNVLVGAHRRLGGFRPAILAPHTLWNADQLYWLSPPSKH